MEASDLKTIRERASWTQAEMGKAVGLSRGTISLMEKGGATVEPRTLKTYLLLGCLLDVRDKHSEALEAKNTARANGLGYVDLATQMLDSINRRLAKMID